MCSDLPPLVIDGKLVEDCEILVPLFDGISACSARIGRSAANRSDFRGSHFDAEKLNARVPPPATRLPIG